VAGRPEGVRELVLNFQTLGDLAQPAEVHPVVVSAAFIDLALSRIVERNKLRQQLIDRGREARLGHGNHSLFWHRLYSSESLRKIAAFRRRDTRMTATTTPATTSRATPMMIGRVAS